MMPPVAGRRSGKFSVPSPLQLEEKADDFTGLFGRLQENGVAVDAGLSRPTPVADLDHRDERTDGGMVPAPLTAAPYCSSTQSNTAIPSFLLESDDVIAASQKGTAKQHPGQARSVWYGFKTVPTSGASTAMESREPDLLRLLTGNPTAGAESTAKTSNMSPVQKDVSQRKFSSQHYKNLESVLAALDKDIQVSQETMDALSSRTHNLCLEVEALEMEKQTLLTLYNETVKNKTSFEEDTQARQDRFNMQHKIQSEADLNEFCESLRDGYSTELNRLQEEISQCERSLQSRRENFDQVKAHMFASPKEAIIQQLRDHLLELVKTIKSEFVCSIKPVLQRSIADHLISADEKRRDIFRNDRDHREQALRVNRDRQSGSFKEFQDDYRIRMSRRRDTAFMELRQLWQSDQNSRWGLVQKRLASHRTQVETQTRRVRQAAEENIRLLRQKDQLSFQALQDLYQTKEQNFEKSLIKDLQTLTDHMQAERHSLISTHHLIRSTYQTHPRRTTETSGSKAPSSSLEGLKLCCDRIRSQVDQIRFSAGAEVHMLKVASSEKHLGHSTSWHVVEETPAVDPVWSLLQRMKRENDDMQPLLSKMHSTISFMFHGLDSFRTTVQATQLQLNTLHNELICVRETWDEDIRRRLSRTFLDANRQVGEKLGLPLLEDLSTECLFTVQTSLEEVMAALGELRGARQQHLEHLAAHLAEVQTKKQDSHAILFSLLELYNKVVQVSGVLKTRQRSINVSEKDLARAQQHFEQDRTEIYRKYNQLGNIASRLRKRFKVLRSVEQSTTDAKLRAQEDLGQPKNSAFLDFVQSHLSGPPKANMVPPPRG